MVVLRDLSEVAEGRLCDNIAVINETKVLPLYFDMVQGRIDPVKAFNHLDRLVERQVSP